MGENVPPTSTDVPIVSTPSTPEETPTQSILELILSKTTMANLVAAVAVIGGVAAGVYAVVKGDMTLLENLAFAGAGFLFGNRRYSVANGKNGN